jgi:hypothetical protein
MEAIERQTGVRLGKRQVEELAGLAAMDFEDFYENRRPARGKQGELLVLSADGKGIVMRPEALRTRAPARPRAGPAPKPRLSGEEQHNRKRMAEIGAVYDAKPAPRTPADILTSAAPEGYEPEPGRPDRRRQPPDRADQVRGSQTGGQGHDRRRLRARPGIPVERGWLSSPQRRSSDRAMGAPPSDQGAPRTSPQGRWRDSAPSDQRPPGSRPPQARRRSRRLPHQQSVLPRLTRPRSPTVGRSRPGSSRVPAAI